MKSKGPTLGNQGVGHAAICGLQKVEALREWFQANRYRFRLFRVKPRYQTPTERAQFLHRWSSQRSCDSQAQNCFSLSAKLPAQGIGLCRLIFSGYWPSR
jgi:hypothetical protein